MRSLFFLPLAALASIAQAQIPPGYYDSAAGLTGEPLRVALNDIISPHTVILYTNLWSAFPRTDKKADGTVWDIYSDQPGGTPAYVYHYGVNQCGTYNSEGDCFNREHSFPVSWFNDVPPMNSDLFHIYPTDGWVNAARGNWPYGTVGSPEYTSSNGSKRGPCTWPGCSGTVFEPLDEYKGDLARGYFYMLTRYMNESTSWPAPIMTGGVLFSWTESLLLAWHTQDPVSAKEIARNDSIYHLQNNRNPYIDNPQWVHSIWGPEAGVGENAGIDAHVFVAQDELVIDLADAHAMQLQVLDITGREVMLAKIIAKRTLLPIPATSGAYIAVLNDGAHRSAFKFVR